ncbi:MAG: YfiR family protein [Oceanococcaceae bacterium]
MHPTRTRGSVRTCVLLAALLASTPAVANDLAQRIKAAFLYNVAKFVDWPHNEGDFHLCIQGAPEFAQTTRSELSGKQVRDRPLVIREQVADVLDCAIVYLGHDLEDAAIVATLRTLRGRPILSVGEAPLLISAGGILRLKQAQGKLRFEVALAPVEESGLRISSKLLRLAEIVPHPTGPSP